LRKEDIKRKFVLEKKFWVRERQPNVRVVKKFGTDFKAYYRE